MKELRLLTDQPIGETNNPRADGLGFSVYADVLVKAITGTPGPLTIGVFGEWGTGKTSLLRMIEAKFQKQNDIIPVWFNAWQYEKEKKPLIPLVAAIQSELIRKHRGNSGVNEMVNLLDAIISGYSLKTKISVPGFELEQAFEPGKVLERDDLLAKNEILGQSIYQEIFERMNGLAAGKGPKILVLVDDLDRCFPDMAIKLLESIKLVLSQPGFMFVLGMSRSVMEGYIKHRYEKEYGLANFDSRSYLDKIIQVPFYIPPASGQIEGFFETLFEQVSLPDNPLAADLRQIIQVTCQNNPRAIIRFINNLMLENAMFNKLNCIDAEDTSSLIYFAVEHGLQQRWPQVFGQLFHSEQLCYWLANAIQTSGGLTSLANPTDADAVVLAREIGGDKELQIVLASDAGREWLGSAKSGRKTIRHTIPLP